MFLEGENDTKNYDLSVDSLSGFPFTFFKLLLLRLFLYVNVTQQKLQQFSRDFAIVLHFKMKTNSIKFSSNIFDVSHALSECFISNVMYYVG